MSLTSGLKFKKLDLQVHTPASDCFLGADVTPEMIVQEAMRKGLAGIAITDHNTGDWIDKVKNAATGKPLAVFPGIEVLVPCGKAGIHVLAILDVDKGTKEISELVGALRLRNVDGHLISEGGIHDVVETITNDIHGGLAILAHCTGPKGALFEISGVQRTSLFTHPNLLAIDVAEDDFLDADKKATGTRAIDLLDGNHSEFCYRRLAVIQTSDNPHPTGRGRHGLEGIGTRFTYFKLDEHIHLEGLRLCFVDRDTRIRQAFEYRENIFPRIKAIDIKGGFLNGVSVPLHEGLNCALGAKGTGKSLLIEFLRFALDQQPTQPEIRSDHDEKLAERLGRYGEVTITIVDETGKETRLTRTYNPAGGNRYKEQAAEQIVRIFPVLFLSQNEIIRVAENESEQLGFIDRFFDFRSFQVKIERLEEQLKKLDYEFAEGLRGFRQTKDLTKQLGVLDKELETIAAQMKNPVFDEFAKADSKERSFLRLRQFLTGLHTRIRTLRERDIDASPIPDLDPGVPDPALDRTAALCAEQKDAVMAQLSAIEESVRLSLNAFDTEYEPSKLVFQHTKRKYDEAVQSQKGDYKALEQRRLRLTKERDAIAQKSAESQSIADKFPAVRDERTAALSELNETYKDYRRERLLKCRKFEADSGGKLSISITESTNVDEFKHRLTSLKRGSYLSDDEIERISATISPFEFIRLILRYDTTEERSQVYLTAIVKLTGIDIRKIQKLADHLLDENKYETLLELQYRARPQDRPEIRYRVSPSKFELLRKLSVGQKCTAMLIMALSDGAMPIVIDQPEDSLDIRSIWEDMCFKLRAGKESRQFVFTTHSSSLAVASDTDKYLVLEADATSGQLAFSGAIDSESVRTQVIEYLEGGVQTYRAKYLKYNIPHRRLSS